MPENIIKKINEAKIVLDGLRPIKKQLADQINLRFRLDWNFHSNHIEGNTLTYQETKSLLLYGVNVIGKPLRDIKEMKGHNEVLKWLNRIISVKYPLTEDFIKELHKQILVDSYSISTISASGYPTSRQIRVGHYKNYQNYIRSSRGEILLFASPHETPEKMAQFVEWFNVKSEEQKQQQHPIFFAAEAHHKFVRIHPFDDGNGRIARILMNFILMKLGYPPIVVMSKEKKEYFTVLQAADEGNLLPLVNFIGLGLFRSVKANIRMIQGEMDILEDKLD